MKAINLIILSVLLITGCSSMSVTERETKRNQLDEMAATAIAGLAEQDATLQQMALGALGLE